MPSFNYLWLGIMYEINKDLFEHLFKKKYVRVYTVRS